MEFIIPTYLQFPLITANTILRSPHATMTSVTARIIKNFFLKKLRSPGKEPQQSELNPSKRIRSPQRQRTKLTTLPQRDGNWVSFRHWPLSLPSRHYQWESNAERTQLSLSSKIHRQKQYVHRRAAKQPWERHTESRGQICGAISRVNLTWNDRACDTASRGGSSSSSSSRERISASLHARESFELAACGRASS